MLNLTLICVGGLKESFWKAACAEYIKRLGRYARVTVAEIEETRLKENPGEGLIEAALENEADRILKKIPSGAFTVALCVEGEHSDSEKFATLLEKRMQTNSDFVFVIGGSYGLSPRVKAAATFKLSLSDMTYPHMTARVVLLEQLYRAFNRMNGGKYHK